MFGFLKQKIADFKNNLKKTISKEEKQQEEIIDEKTEVLQSKETLSKTKEEEKIVKEPKEDPIKTVLDDEKESTKKENNFEKNKKEEIKEKKEEEIKNNLKENLKTEKETLSLNTKTNNEKKEVQKKGFFEKILNFGKKEEKIKTKGKKILQPNLPLEERKETLSPKIEIQKETISVEKEINKKIEAKEKKTINEEKIKKEEIDLEKTNQNEEKFEENKENEEEYEKEEEEKEIEEENLKIRKEKPRNIAVARVDEDKRELKANVGIGSGLKGILFGGIEISEKQIEDLLFELELSLIEGDVEQDAALELVNQIKQRIIGKKVSAKNIDAYLQEQIKEILREMMKTEKIDILENIKKAKNEGEVYKILILGPNGAGKTTSIAKLVNYFKKNNLSCIIAAGDTFRAGAIDQIEIHAKNLGVRVIKHQYGADPAAIAFDAINAAKAGKIDVVLIDSAGRQETNKNLMEELKKLERVAKPDLKLFVGESYVGQGLLDQVEEFEKMIGIEGYILTKMDTDAKGGSAISLTYKTKKPILFIGTGQEYNDFEEFTPEYILNRII